MGDYRGSIGKLYVKPIVDLKTAMEALDKCMESIIDNPNNLSFIRNLDKDYIRSFVKDVTLGILISKESLMKNGLCLLKEEQALLERCLII